MRNREHFIGLWLNDSEYRQLLKRVKKQVLEIPGLDADRQKTGEMHKKQQNYLSCVNSLSLFFLPKTKHGKALICVDRHADRYEIF